MSFLPNPNQATLLVIDIQERLIPAMPEAEAALVVKQTDNLIALFREYGGEVLYSEQYPRGLGPTVAPLREALGESQRFEKTHFSVLRSPEWLAWATDKKPGDIILTGMETHICVTLTALDLLAAGYRVFIPHDAVSSRTTANRDNGLAMMEKAGAIITNTESLIFHALNQAGGDVFKAFSARIK